MKTKEKNDVSMIHVDRHLIRAVSSRFKRVLKEEDLNIAALAARTGVPSGIIREVEAGRLLPPFKLLYFLYHDYNINITGLLLGHGLSYRVAQTPPRAKALDSARVHRLFAGLGKDEYGDIAELLDRVPQERLDEFFLHLTDTTQTLCWDIAKHFQTMYLEYSLRKAGAPEREQFKERLEFQRRQAFELNLLCLYIGADIDLVGRRKIPAVKGNRFFKFLMLEGLTSLGWCILEKGMIKLTRSGIKKAEELVSQVPDDGFVPLAPLQPLDKRVFDLHLLLLYLTGFSAGAGDGGLEEPVVLHGRYFDPILLDEFAELGYIRLNPVKFCFLEPGEKAAIALMVKYLAQGERGVGSPET